DTACTNRWSIESCGWSNVLHERHLWRHIRSAGLAPLIIVFIEPHICSHSENMCAADDAQVVEDLWRRYSPKCSRRVDIWKTDRFVKLIGSPAWSICKGKSVGAPGFFSALGKEEYERSEARREFVHDARRNRLAITDR